MSNPLDAACAAFLAALPQPWDVTTLAANAQFREAVRQACAAYDAAQWCWDMDAASKDCRHS